MNTSSTSQRMPPKGVGISASQASLYSQEESTKSYAHTLASMLLIRLLTIYFVVVVARYLSASRRKSFSRGRGRASIIGSAVGLGPGEEKPEQIKRMWRLASTSSAEGAVFVRCELTNLFAVRALPRIAYDECSEFESDSRSQVHSLQAVWQRSAMSLSLPSIALFLCLSW